MIDYTKLRLKVLQGVNKGAVASFLSDSLVIGSSPECDIVLSGFTTSEPRIGVSYINDRLVLKVINKPVMLDGVLINPSEKYLPLKLYQLISFETCCLTVGEKGKDWPSCEKNRNYIEPHVSNKLNIGLIPGAFLLKNSSTTKKVGILLFLFVVVFTIFIYMADAKKPNNSTMLNSISQKEVINTLKLKSQKQDENIRGRKIEKLAYGLLQTYGVNRIDLNYQNSGILIAKGYVGDSIKWEKAKTSILEDIKDIKKIDTSKIETFTQRAINFNQMLLSKELKKNLKVSINEKTDVIRVSGELTHSAIKDWLSIKNNYVNKYKDTPRLESKIVDIEDRVKLLIRSVNIGKTKFFTSNLGKKYMIGSDLGSGFRVLEIEVDRITLSYKGDRIPVYYSKEINQKSSLIY